MLNSSSLMKALMNLLSYENEQVIRSVVTISILILSLYLILLIQRSRVARVAQPPGPRGLPIVGYLPFLGNNLHRSFTKLAQVYGPIYKLKLGNKLCLVVSSPLMAKHVLRDQDRIFANRDPPIVVKVSTHGGNDIAFSPYGAGWRKMRKVLVGELLSNKTLDGCYHLRKQEVEKMIRNVHEKVGEVVDLGQLAFVALIDTIMSVLWGGTLHGEEGTRLRDEYRKAVMELMVLFAEPNVSDFFPMLARFDFQGLEKKAKRVTVWLQKIVDCVIEQHQKKTESDEEGKSFLQLVMELRERDDPSTSITLDQSKGVLHDVVMGGTDTTSTMVEWTMAEMMKHPKILKRVQQELDEVVGSNISVEELHVPKLQYLNAVVKETLRLHPVLPLLVPHSSSSSTTVAGFTIPKGTQVFINVWAIHRDPEYWENPLEFRPERFLNDENCVFDFTGNNFQYLPFGSGRRICAGIPLAEKMLVYLLASLLHSFEWNIPNDTTLELEEKSGIVIRKMKPLLVIPTLRFPASMN